MNDKIFIAYIQRIVYPDNHASGIQSLLMASAFKKLGIQTIFYTHDVLCNKNRLFRYYGIDVDLPIKHYRMTKRKVYKNGVLRFMTYNSLVLWDILRKHLMYKDYLKVIFVRSKYESLFWGYFRPYIPFLKNWILIYEAHELASFPRDFMSNYKEYVQKKNIKRRIKALKNFDLMITITNRLKEDLEKIFENKILVYIPLSSGLSRIKNFRPVNLSRDKFRICYIGTICGGYIDKGEGNLIKAFYLLPNNFELMIAGYIRSKSCDYLQDLGKNSRIKVLDPIPYKNVDRFIDKCDIAVQPASVEDIISQKYTSPLKLFDYMVRGKAIIAADVPSHRELLTDGYNVIFYKPDDPRDLASKIRLLAENTDLLNRISYNAWKDSYKYTHSYRAQKILEIIKNRRNDI